MRNRTPAPVALLALTLLACGPSVQGSRPSAPREPIRIEELWVEPTDLASRDLYYGVGGTAQAPIAGTLYQFVSKDTTGFSPGYDVRDPEGRRWSVKQGPEAQTEVVASRLLWAIGYHQPPAYYVAGWTLVGGDTPGPQSPGRFRPEPPEERKIGTWSWDENPFVDAQPFRGLIVLMLIMNSQDFKDSNTAVYEVAAGAGLERRYVVRDLGLSFGRTGLIRMTRNDLRGFEEHGFIKGVRNGRVQFEYRGRHARDLIAALTPADVRWTCDRLAMLTPQQWTDAFRAGGYSTEATERYVRKLQEKILQGLALP